MMVYESNAVPINHRDASNTSRSPWTKSPTFIPVPGKSEPQRRPHDNPFFRSANNLGSRHPHPGNPNARQTVLAKARDGCSHGADSRPRKRQRLDTSISSITTSNGTSYPRGLASRGNIAEPDIQMIESSRASNSRTNPIPNDAEIIDLGASSDDLGERISCAAKSKSPDPLLLASKPPVHAFETHPTEYSPPVPRNGKGRAKPTELVEGSEEDEDIEEFTPPPPKARPRKAKKSGEIPVNIVSERREFFEGPCASASAVIHPSTEKGVKSVDLTTGTIVTVVNRMKKRDEGALGSLRSTDVADHVGTSSSNLFNSDREKEKIQKLPLEAWCLGQHVFRHSESAPLQFEYEAAKQQIKVTWGRPPAEEIVFGLRRDVHSAMIVNDTEGPLRENIVVQFGTISESTWEATERKYKGFKGGGDRGREVLTFLFSTSKHRGFSATEYQKFVTKIRRVFGPSAVQIIGPRKGGKVWEFADRISEMFEQEDSRNRKEESVLDKPSIRTRSVTPSSVSVRTGSALKSSNRDLTSSMSRRRSARQSEIRSSRASPTPPLGKLEPDEVVLMYPPTGVGALSIMHSDLRRLQPEEYLNDTLIEFGLKLWLNDLRGKDPVLADQIHVFSSFFYKKLHNRKNPEDGYQSVRKWTSKIDVFSKKYIIVPINENIHWYLAIIYEPGHTLEPPVPLLRLSNPRVTRKRKQQECARVNSETEVALGRSGYAPHTIEGESEVDTSSMDATCATTPSISGNEEMDDVATIAFDKSCSINSGSEPIEIQARDSSPDLVHPPSDVMDVDPPVTDIVSNLTHEAGKKLGPSVPMPSTGIPVDQFYGCTSKPRVVKPVVVANNEDSGEDQQQEAEVDNMLAITQPSLEDLPRTYIFTLDSLGARHPQAIKVLKQYLSLEAKDKRNFDEVRDAVGKQVQVPVQPNTWDCGIYLLHFVKVFMSAPLEFVEQILSTRSTMPSSERKKMWQDHEVPQSRDYLKSRIIQLSEEWKAEKTVREEKTNRRSSGDAMGPEVLSSEGEVDIVEDTRSVKAVAGPGQQQPASRLRG